MKSRTKETAKEPRDRPFLLGSVPTGFQRLSLSTDGKAERACESAAPQHRSTAAPQPRHRRAGPTTRSRLRPRHLEQQALTGLSRAAPSAHTTAGPTTFHFRFPQAGDESDSATRVVAARGRTQRARRRRRSRVTETEATSAQDAGSAGAQRPFARRPDPRTPLSTELE